MSFFSFHLFNMLSWARTCLLKAFPSCFSWQSAPCKFEPLDGLFRQLIIDHIIEIIFKTLDYLFVQESSPSCSAWHGAGKPPGQTQLILVFGQKKTLDRKFGSRRSLIIWWWWSSMMMMINYHHHEIDKGAVPRKIFATFAFYFPKRSTLNCRSDITSHHELSSYDDEKVTIESGSLPGCCPDSWEMEVTVSWLFSWATSFTHDFIFYNLKVIFQLHQ